MWKEFKEFAIKGNAIDLAVGVIIGAAFGKIVSSIVEDVIMPPIGAATGGLDFSNLYLPLSSKVAPGLAPRPMRRSSARSWPTGISSPSSSISPSLPSAFSWS